MIVACASTVDGALARATGRAHRRHRSRRRAGLRGYIRAVVSLVSARQATRGQRNSAARALHTGRSPVACASTVDGALARATGRARTSGPFAREMSRDEATSLARAVLDSGKSRQPADVLTKVYLAHSQGKVPNAIAAAVGLPHSTVDRAIAAAAVEIAGTRPV